MEATILSTWWFAGELSGMASLANDETSSEMVRRLCAERAVDLADNWLIGDLECRRIKR